MQWSSNCNRVKWKEPENGEWRTECYCEREGLFILNPCFCNVMPNLDSVTVPCIYHIKSCLHKVVLFPTDLTGCWSVVCLVYAAGVRMEPAMNVLLSAASSFSRSINGLQLRFKVILVSAGSFQYSVWWDQDFTWEFSVPFLSPQIHNHGVVPLSICMHHTCFSALEMQYEMKIRILKKYLIFFEH